MTMVADGICKKLIERHPHVFGTTEASTSEQVLKNWDEIKQKSKGQTTAGQTLLSVPKTLPMLMRSQKVQSRAAKAGFDYPNAQMALDDLQSEVRELTEAVAAQNGANMDEELGDVLFSCVNVARFLKLDAEESLGRSCEKFIRRFLKVEELATAQNVDMHQADIDTLNALWKQAKKLQ